MFKKILLVFVSFLLFLANSAYSAPDPLVNIGSENQNHNNNQTANAVVATIGAAAALITGGYLLIKHKTGRSQEAQEAQKIYIVDHAGASNGRVQTFDINGNYLSEFDTTGISLPDFIAVDNDRNIMVSQDDFDQGVPNTGVVKKYDQNGTSIPINISAADEAAGIAFDNAGNIYAALFSLQIIRRYNSVGSNPVNLTSAAGSSSTPLATDKNGYIYTATDDGSALTKYDLAATPPISPSLTVNNVGDSPKNIAFDSNGNIYVVAYGDNEVTKTPSGGGTPVALVLSGLTVPYGIAIDRNNNIYVTDIGDSTVKVYSSDGTSLFTFGSVGTSPGEFLGIRSIAIK